MLSASITFFFEKKAKIGQPLLAVTTVLSITMFRIF
jgi:hypothetical protein